MPKANNAASNLDLHIVLKLSMLGKVDNLTVDAAKSEQTSSCGALLLPLGALPDGQRFEKLLLCPCQSVALS